MSSRFVPGAFSLKIPMDLKDQNIVMRTAAPSTIAVSTTWPLPDFCASSRAQTTPYARNMPPPPKSPTMLSGGTGASPLRAKCASEPASAM